MERTGLVRRLLEPCAVAAFMAVLAACGGGDGGTPSPPPLQPATLSIKGLPAAAMVPGQSALLTAVMTFADGSAADVKASAAWGSSNSGALVVSPLGTLQAVAPGRAEVVASAQGLSARGTITVAMPGPPLALFAGNLGGIGNADGPRADASFWRPVGIAADNVGNIYVTDSGTHLIRKISAEGIVSTLTGKLSDGSDDGVGSEAQFNAPYGIATDGSGNVYVSELWPSTIRKITPAGVVSTLAGTPFVTGSSDGVGAEASFRVPRGLATDRDGNVYVADSLNHTIRRITPEGRVSTLAGAPGVAGSTDGAGADARFNGPYGVATDGRGRVYVTDRLNFTLRGIGADGTVTSLAGAVAISGSADGIGTEARFFHSEGIAADGFGNLLVADTGNSIIRKVASSGVVSTLAGTRSPGYADGIGAAARFSSPTGVAVDSLGNAYVADTDSSTIRRISPDGQVSTFAGSVSLSGAVDAVGKDARFLAPVGVAADSVGNVYVADYGNSTIRRITPSASASTLAGRAGEPGQVDGSGADARFAEPSGVATDRAGNVYVIDSIQNVVRRVTPSGRVSTLAGTGELGSADGDAARASFGFCPPGYLSHGSPTVDCRSAGIAVDAGGSIYLADTYNHTIRKISPSGVVSTVAGLAGASGSVDGVGAEARFNQPRGIAVDAAGNIYVADTGETVGLYIAPSTRNSTIRKIDPTGRVSTLAGQSGVTGSADGTGAEARFCGPRGIAVDDAGNLFVADSGNNSIRRISPAGVVTTVIGAAGTRGFVPGALPGAIDGPVGVAISDKLLYITLRNGVAVVTNLP